MMQEQAEAASKKISGSPGCWTSVQVAFTHPGQNQVNTCIPPAGYDENL